MEHNALGWTVGRQGESTGTTVEVRTRYLAGQWARGYEVAEVLPGGYRVRRRGSRELLSEIFHAADVRPDGVC
jgi:hypothetical protein